ncbi:MAG TPA: hypothetical protein VK669_09265 [Candidatus Limnocylindrales bacterium]|nr:hypothetical protein [Candidatus Limnocylindrales bacterium]
MKRLLAALGILAGGAMIVLGLGWSSSQSEPVSQAVFERLPASVELLVSAFIGAIVIGGITGLARARARAAVVRGTVAAAVLVCRAIPVATAVLLVQLAIIFTPPAPHAGTASPNAFDDRELILFRIAPVLVLAVLFGAWASVIFYDRFRASLDVRMRRRDILTTIATTAALLGPALASATILVEPSFAWPGVQRVFGSALHQFDVRLGAGFVVLYLSAVIAVEVCTGSAHTEQPAPRDPRRRLSPAGVAACATLLAAVLAAAVAPLVTPADPNSIDQAHWMGYPLPPGTAGHVLGTDENGRDLLARLLFGLRTSLGITAGAVVIATVLSALAAWAFRSVRWIGTERALGVVAIRPFGGFPLILVAVMLLVGTTRSRDLPSPFLLAGLIGAVSWPAGIAAFRVSGARRLSGIVALTGGAFLLETTISSIGFGVQPPAPSLGNMLVNAFSNLTVAPAVTLAPWITITAVLGALYALADALRDMPERRSERSD